MQKIYPLFTALFFVMMWMPVAAQNVSIKPHYGYFLPRLTNVNDVIQSSIEAWGRQLGAPVPSPGKFNGSPVFGAQFEYHLNEDYFVNMNLAYYQEEVGIQYSSPPSVSPFYLDFQREIKMYDVMFNLHYYFDYSSWRRFNKYIGVGLGLILVNAESFTFLSQGGTPALDTQGEFSGNSLSAVFSAGGNLRLSNFFLLWAEAGFQYGNMGQLDGKVSFINDPQRHDVISESSFDLTGFYLRGGVGIALPFLK